MKKIKLYGKFGKDKYALVDNLDIGLVSKLKWWVSKKKNCFYAYTELGDKHIKMHRYVLGLTLGDRKIVDHKNGDGLDNQRKNLRLVDWFQSNANKKIPITNTSGFKGV